MENNELIKYNSDLIKKTDNAICVTNKLLNIQLKNIYAIYLDDHKIFSKAVKNGIIPFFNNLKIDSFEEPISALSHIEYCLKSNIKLDLIISDLKHPEPDGFDFSRTIRDVERIYNKRIPILIISMYISYPLWPKIIEFLDDKTFDKVLPKHCQIREIVEAIKELTK